MCCDWVPPGTLPAVQGLKVVYEKASRVLTVSGEALPHAR